MSRHWNPDRAIVQLRPTRRDTGPALAVALLIGAAVFGVGAGAVLNWIEAPSAVAPATSVETEIVIPEVQADSTDAEWAGRASSVVASGREAIQPGLPRPSGARNDGARVAFGYCHSGGGTNCVVDGDTFYIGGAKVRIAGIDAPETHPPRCSREAQLGDQATHKLQALLNSGAVTITGIDRDRDTYGRLLRNVSVDGQDVGEALIAAGVAREYGRGRRGWC
jgi:endonuclease YncB( thermonuclease family)